MNRHIWTHRTMCEAMVSGEPRQCRVIKINSKTVLVQPLSRHPSCVHLNSLHTKIIKRHIVKHNVTIDLCGPLHLRLLARRMIKGLKKGSGE
jgi:hypothetical protein